MQHVESKKYCFYIFFHLPVEIATAIDLTWFLKTQK